MECPPKAQRGEFLETLKLSSETETNYLNTIESE